MSQYSVGEQVRVLTAAEVDRRWHNTAGVCPTSYQGCEATIEAVLADNRYHLRLSDGRPLSYVRGKFLMYADIQSPPKNAVRIIQTVYVPIGNDGQEQPQNAVIMPLRAVETRAKIEEG